MLFFGNEVQPVQNAQILEELFGWNSQFLKIYIISNVAFFFKKFRPRLSDADCRFRRNHRGRFHAHVCVRNLCLSD